MPLRLAQIPTVRLSIIGVLDSYAMATRLRILHRRKNLKRNWSWVGACPDRQHSDRFLTRNEKRLKTSRALIFRRLPTGTPILRPIRSFQAAFGFDRKIACRQAK